MVQNVIQLQERVIVYQAGLVKNVNCLVHWDSMEKTVIIYVLV